MKHREAKRTIKTRIRERHCSGVLAQDLHVVIQRTAAEAVGKSCVDLNARELFDPVLQDCGYGSVAGANLDNLGTEVEALKRPGNYILLHSLFPSR
jgi:hypothetical protein